MPPKRRTFVLNEVTAARNSPVPSKLARKSGVVTLRKIAMHPGTSVMVVEALKDLDSRKGVSKQAIQNFIKRKYPSVDKIRLKYYVRRALGKGLEDGTLVRLPNSTVTTGVVDKFRLAPKRKESKAKVEPRVQKAAEVEPRVQKAAEVEPRVQKAAEVEPRVQKAAEVEPRVQKAAKVENVEPNVQKSSKVAKEDPKTKDGRTKKAAADDKVKPPKKKATKGSDKSKEDEEAPPSKVPPAKKSKGKKAAIENVESKGTVGTKTKPKEAVADGKTKAKPKEPKGKADEAAPKSAPKKGRKKNAK